MKTTKSKKDLEKMRPIFFQIGLITALSVSLLAFEWKTLERELPTWTRTDAGTLDVLPDVTVHEKEEEPLPKPKKTVLFNEVDDNIPVDDEVIIFDPEDELNKELEAWEPPLPDEGDENREKDVFIVVEDSPSFPGGYNALMRFLQENIKYPKTAREANITGTVYLNFIVDKSGMVRDIKVLRGIGGGCDEEALRVVRMMPKWKPGKQRGKAVNVSFNLPVHFTLKD